jgi:hypothetical protein
VQTAQAYALICIAEAQSLTASRAIRKGNAASLVASLSVDAAAAFSAAAGTAQGIRGAKADCKFVQYAEYQAAVHQAYGLAFAGQRKPIPVLHSLEAHMHPAFCSCSKLCSNL